MRRILGTNQQSRPWIIDSFIRGLLSPSVPVISAGHYVPMMKLYLCYRSKMIFCVTPNGIRLRSIVPIEYGWFSLARQPSRRTKWQNNSVLLLAHKRVPLDNRMASIGSHPVSGAILRWIMCILFCASNRFDPLTEGQNWKKINDRAVNSLWCLAFLFCE